MLRINKLEKQLKEGLFEEEAEIMALPVEDRSDRCREIIASRKYRTESDAYYRALDLLLEHIGDQRIKH